MSGNISCNRTVFTIFWGGIKLKMGENYMGKEENGDGNLEEPKMLWVRIRKRVRK